MRFLAHLSGVLWACGRLVGCVGAAALRQPTYCCCRGGTPFAAACLPRLLPACLSHLPLPSPHLLTPRLCRPFRPTPPAHSQKPDCAGARRPLLRSLANDQDKHNKRTTSKHPPAHVHVQKVLPPPPALLAALALELGGDVRPLFGAMLLHQLLQQLILLQQSSKGCYEGSK